MQLLQVFVVVPGGQGGLLVERLRGRFDAGVDGDLAQQRSRLILFENSTQMLAVFTIYTSSQVVQPEKCFVLRGTICCITHSFPSRPSTQKYQLRRMLCCPGWSCRPVVEYEVQYHASVVSTGCLKSTRI